MSFRRIPFQFSSIDPVERQAELEKRFGLPAKNMYVDVANPFSTGAARNGSTNSPRLQHRVPIFLDGHEQPIQSSVEPVDQTSNTKKSPNVRVIPIEVEGEYRPSNRHRTHSGPAGVAKAPSSPVQEECLKRSVEDLSQPTKVQVNGNGSKVHHIPIQIEGKDFTPKKTLKAAKKQEHPVVNSYKPKTGNGCASSKQVSTVSPGEKAVERKPSPAHVVENSVESSLKKVEEVLKELEAYEKGVNKFSGTVKEKQYRYLDEMLTRCMLRLDNVETFGNSDVRTARKNAVRKVQACIDLLESKVKTEEPQLTEQTTIQTTDVEMQESSEASAEQNDSEGQLDVQMAEVQSGGDGVPEVQMAEVQTCMEGGQSDLQMAEVQQSDDSSEGAVSVTKLEPDSEGVNSAPELGFVQPEVEMSKNQLESEVKGLGEYDGECAVVIEEVSDKAAGEVHEVTMAEVDSESLPIVDEGSPADSDESSVQNLETGEGVTVTEIDENEVSEADADLSQTLSACEKTVTDSETLLNEVKSVPDNASVNVTEL